MTWFTCVLLFLLAYCLAYMHGWITGYEKCSQDTIKTMDEYFDKEGKK